jgi:hypothetical protein
MTRHELSADSGRCMAKTPSGRGFSVSARRPGELPGSKFDATIESRPEVSVKNQKIKEQNQCLKFV